MFSLGCFVCLSVYCLFGCEHQQDYSNHAQTLLTDFHEILWVDEVWGRRESVTFFTDGVESDLDQRSFFHFSIMERGRV